MVVKRIVANINATQPAAAKAFYHDLLVLALLMDPGWIQTYGHATTMSVQVSVASDGVSGLPVPDFSIDVNNLDDLLDRMQHAGFTPEYGPTTEPWGVRRFCVRDPFGQLVNILQHE